MTIKEVKIELSVDMDSPEHKKLVDFLFENRYQFKVTPTNIYWKAGNSSMDEDYRKIREEESLSACLINNPELYTGSICGRCYKNPYESGCPEGEITTNIFKYKGYTGSAEYSKEDDCWHGKILDIEDSFTYEAGTREGLFDAFKTAVDEYNTTR